MEFPPSCRTQLFCKLQTHFYSLAFHRLCLSWKHQGASPESVWQHPPPPHIIFCRQRGGAGRRGGCVFMLLDETNSLMPGIYQVCRGESLNISVRRRWNVTRSILWSTGMKYNSVVLLLQYFHFFSEAFNVRSRKMFDFLLHCIYFDTFRHFADRMLHQSQYSTVFNTFLLLPVKPSKKKSSQQRCQ